jgi:hypothetical protein
MGRVVAFFMTAALKAASVAAGVISFASSFTPSPFLSFFFPPCFLNKLQRSKSKVAFLFNLPFTIVFLFYSFFSGRFNPIQLLPSLAVALMTPLSPTPFHYTQPETRVTVQVGLGQQRAPISNLDKGTNYPD